ncbi:hypothetical protein Hdeb2414_s0065g00766391 [Helianthus debilis subsp. tardiflorus]
MGDKCPHGRVKKRRYSHCHKTFRLAKFLLKKPDNEKMPLWLDEDLPGMG